MDAIQEKLRPGHIAAAAADRVRGAATTAVRDVATTAAEKAEDAMETTRRMADRLVDDGRMNRFAGALIGIGAAWLLMERWRRSTREQSWRREPAVDYGYDVEPSPWSREGVVGESYHRASATAREMGDRAAETAHRVTSGFERLLHSNPLMVGAAAVAVGATVGLALPETETENEWLGETRDTMVERAQEVATEMRQAAGEIAGQVASEVVSGRQDDSR
jgi:ElaB/YqjD/DUF883 family membrane-anchored ribosome-binding protein